MNAPGKKKKPGPPAGIGSLSMGAPDQAMGAPGPSHLGTGETTTNSSATGPQRRRTTESKNAPEFEIRPMRTADLDEVVALAVTLEHAPTWPLAAYARALDSSVSPLRIALVAADSASGALQGFAIAAIAPYEPPEAELEMIGVSATHRRRGLALELFASLRAELRRAGVREIYLEVRASNRPALALYRALGFEQTGLRPRYYSHPQEDAVLMRLQLAN
jgi:[ribosomal protein S18]-alanine N-acetyltransferase